MKKLCIAIFFMMLCIINSSAQANAIPVSDLSVESFFAVCQRKAHEQNRGVKIGEVVHDNELSNIEGMDAWLVAVGRDYGKVLLTVQTQEDKIMAIFFTMSYDMLDKQDDVMQTMLLANDLRPIVASAIGMSNDEAAELFDTNFAENPQGSIWSDSMNRYIIYTCNTKEEWNMLYFMIYASDQKPEKSKNNK